VSSSGRCFAPAGLRLSSIWLQIMFASLVVTPGVAAPGLDHVIPARPSP
jgi:hypothetical protein